MKSEVKHMSKQTRWNEILNITREKESVTVTQLQKELGVSVATIRRDLQEMDDLNLLIRFHGGAKMDTTQYNEPSMLIKTARHKEEKKRIGLLAARQIKDNQMVYLDAGSTTYEIIPFIKAKNITIVTPGIPHIELLGKAGISTIALGGYVYWNTQSIIGHPAMKQLENLYFDIAFIGTNGIHEQSGFSTSNELEASTKSLAMEHAHNSFVVCDRTKFNQLRPVKFASLDQATIITDSIDQFDTTKIRYMLTKG